MLPVLRDWARAITSAHLVSVRRSCYNCSSSKVALFVASAGGIGHSRSGCPGLSLPQRGRRYRHIVYARGGMSQFPYLVDPNTAKSLYESSQIVRYLFNNYGYGSVPLMLRLRLLADLTSTLASYMRLFQGTYYRNAHQPKRLLELYSIEPCPHSRFCSRGTVSAGVSLCAAQCQSQQPAPRAG